MLGPGPFHGNGTLQLETFPEVLGADLFVRGKSLGGILLKDGTFIQQVRYPEYWDKVKK